jgi:hypothetical protein
MSIRRPADRLQSDSSHFKVNMTALRRLNTATYEHYLENMMNYLCLVYLDEKRLDELPDEDCVDYDTQIRASGHCIASEALQPVATATTVRVRNSKVSVTDGPFAETKEQLAGFYMIEAKDLNEAIRIASKIPPARVGSIEVRPVRPIRESVAEARSQQREAVKE